MQSRDSRAISRLFEMIEAIYPMQSVSVALATYNGGDYLAAQLASLACQSYLPGELVVSDDGSTDDTLALVEQFEKVAPFPVRVLPPHGRLGFSDNFLHTAEHCHGDYIAFCDQDDEWLPTKLERQVERLRRDHSLLALHTLMVADADLRPTGSIWKQDIAGDAVMEPLELNPYRTGWGNSMVFDRRLIDLIDRANRPRQPQESRLPLSHDTWIFTLACALGRVSYMAEPLLLYRQHGANTYGVGPMPWQIRVEVALRFHQSRLEEERAFDCHLAHLFERLGSEEGTLADASARAAIKYAQRSSLCSERLTTFRGKTISKRVRAFRNARQWSDYAPSLASTVKDILMGITGVSQIMPFLVD